MDTISRVLPIILIIMFQLVILAILNLSSYISSTNSFSTGTLTSFMLPVNWLLGLLMVASILVIKRVLETTEEELRKEVQLENMGYLESLITTMRVQRHNFNHELQTVYGLLVVEEYREARKYLEETIPEVAVTNNLVRLDDLGVSALLHVKSSQMESKGIKFEVNIQTRIKELPLKNHEINLILSNLLDNAMEVVKLKKSSQESLIILELTRHQNNYALLVSNNGPAINSDIKDRIFLPGFTTKSQNRGMGLYIVKQIVEKYKGQITVNTDSNWTIFIIQIPIAGGKN